MAAQLNPMRFITIIALFVTATGATEKAGPATAWFPRLVTSLGPQNLPGKQ